MDLLGYFSQSLPLEDDCYLQAFGTADKQVMATCTRFSSYYSATERGETQRPIELWGVERRRGFSWDAF